MKVELYNGPTDRFRDAFYKAGSQDYDCTAEERLVPKILSKLADPSDPLIQISTSTARESQTFPINNTHTVYYRESDGLCIKTSQIGHVGLARVEGRITIEAYFPDNLSPALTIREDFDKLRVPKPSNPILAK